MRFTHTHTLNLDAADLNRYLLALPSLPLPPLIASLTVRKRRLWILLACMISCGSKSLWILYCMKFQQRKRRLVRVRRAAERGDNGHWRWGELVTAETPRRRDAVTHAADSLHVTPVTWHLVTRTTDPHTNKFRSMRTVFMLWCGTSGPPPRPRLESQQWGWLAAVAAGRMEHDHQTPGVWGLNIGATRLLPRFNFWLALNSLWVWA